MAPNKISQCYVLFSLFGIFHVLPLVNSGRQADRLICPKGWIHLVSSCYYFSTTKTTMSSARSSCKNLGGDMVLPVNDKEHNAIWKVANEKNFTYPWIGLVEKQRDVFFTLEGKTPSYTNWGTRQPNPGGNETCVVFWSGDGMGRWHDIACDKKFYFICQQPTKSCLFPLGMESGKIKDAQISVSSALIDSMTGGQARLRQNIGPWGAWCPKTVRGSIFETTFDEYIQIDLLNVTNVAGVATQGREFRVGVELVKEYIISYSQDGRTWTFYPGKDQVGDAKIFQANKNVSGVVVNEVNPAVTARYIRVHPGYTRGTYLCMRLELYCCVCGENEEVIVSYSMPVGQGIKNGKIQYKDTSYTGVISNETYRDGTGILTDGKFGPVNANEFRGEGWVGWSPCFTESRYIPITFEFSVVRKFKDVTLTLNVNKSRDSAVFTRSEIFFSSDEKGFSNSSFLQYCPSVVPVKVDQYNTNITLPLCENAATFIKMKLYFGGKWLLISEISFNSVSVSGNEKQLVQKCSEDSLASCSVSGASTTPRSICKVKTKSSNPPIIVTKNLNTPVIVAIVVSVVILFIIVFGFLEYKRRQKAPQMTTSVNIPEENVEIRPSGRVNFAVQLDQEAVHATPAISGQEPLYEEVQSSPPSVCTKLDRNKQGGIEASEDNNNHEFLQQASDYVLPAEDEAEYVIPADRQTGSYEEVNISTPPGYTELSKSKQDESTANDYQKLLKHD